MGVRNKFCSACAQNIPKDKHRCFKNWETSSSEMETDAIVEGFLLAEKVHGVRYTTVIGDGDSSVYPSLIQRVPGWGHCIRKMECANHVCKCYRSSLEKLVSENPGYKGSGSLTERMRKRLVSAARCAIKMRSKESDRRLGVKLLISDLKMGLIIALAITSDVVLIFVPLQKADVLCWRILLKKQQHSLIKMKN